MRLDHIRNYLDEQTSRMEFIASAVNNMLSIKSNISSQRIETSRSALMKEWNKFSLTNDVITMAVSRLNSWDKKYIFERPYFKEKLFDATQEDYLNSLEAMSTMLYRLQNSLFSIESNSQSSIFTTNFNSELPHLTLPTFDGCPSEWLHFKDLFGSMVLSNETLTPEWKLDYLKQSLTGTASLILKSTTRSGDNFQKAWDSLVSFCENKRLLVNSILESLFAIKPITKESSVELEDLYTTVNQIYRSLKILDRPVESWDDILVFSAVQKLDPESIKRWEQHLGFSKEPPSWSQFLDYLLSRLLALKTVEKSGENEPQPVKAHRNFDGPTSVNKCTICSLDHYTAKCPKYRNKSVKDKMELIKKHKLCFNCLLQHRVANCRNNRRCIKCGKRHHTSIHLSDNLEKCAKPTSNDNSARVKI